MQAQHGQHEAAVGRGHLHHLATTPVEHEGVRRVGLGTGGGGHDRDHAVAVVLVPAEVLHHLARAMGLGLEHQGLQVESGCVGRHYLELGRIAQQVVDLVVEDQRQPGQRQQQQKQRAHQAAPERVVHAGDHVALVAVVAPEPVAVGQVVLVEQVLGFHRHAQPLHAAVQATQVVVHGSVVHGVGAYMRHLGVGGVAVGQVRGEAVVEHVAQAHVAGEGLVALGAGGVALVVEGGAGVNPVLTPAQGQAPVVQGDLVLHVDAG
uniref:Secreted protein n=1 Tax=Steinernema glaseri TaxID=37863 RepID=A0A1I7Y381_9BILA